jgi:hypothetical protein
MNYLFYFILLQWYELILQVTGTEGRTIVDNTNYYLAIFTAILVIVTAVLAAIIGYYAKQTKKSVTAIEESTKAQFKPFLKTSIIHLGPEDIAIKITNVGKGSAEKIKISFSATIGGSVVKKTWEQELMSPSEFQTFFIPKTETQTESDIKFFEASTSVVAVEWECKDILGEDHEGKASINLTDYVKQLPATIAVYQEDPLNKISRNIEKIKDIFVKIEGHLKK